jgi:hypothetical protein
LTGTATISKQEPSQNRISLHIISLKHRTRTKQQILHSHGQSSNHSLSISPPPNAYHLHGRQQCTRERRPNVRAYSSAISFLKHQSNVSPISQPDLKVIQYNYVEHERMIRRIYIFSYFLSKTSVANHRPTFIASRRICSCHIVSYRSKAVHQAYRYCCPLKCKYSPVPANPISFVNRPIAN